MNTIATVNTARERILFQALDANGDGLVSADEVLEVLGRTGLVVGSDPRLRATFEALRANAREALDLRQFCFHLFDRHVQFDPTHHRNQQSRQDGDDGDDHQQFNQGEATRAAVVGRGSFHF